MTVIQSRPLPFTHNNVPDRLLNRWIEKEQEFSSNPDKVMVNTTQNVETRSQTVTSGRDVTQSTTTRKVETENGEATPLVGRLLRARRPRPLITETMSCNNQKDTFMVQCKLPLDRINDILSKINKTELSNVIEKSDNIKSDLSVQTDSNSISPSTVNSELMTNVGDNMTDVETINKSFFTSPIRIMCLFCDRTFVSNVLLQKHTERSHHISSNRRCSSRNIEQTPSVNFHPGCNFCSKNNSIQTATNLAILFNHLLDEHSLKYFACRKCKIRFSTKEILISHNLEVHGIITNDNDESSISDQINENNDLTHFNTIIEGKCTRSSSSSVNDKELQSSQSKMSPLKHGFKNSEIISDGKDVFNDAKEEKKGKNNVRKHFIRPKSSPPTHRDVQKSVRQGLFREFKHSEKLKINDSYVDFEENIMANLILPQKKNEGISALNKKIALDQNAVIILDDINLDNKLFKNKNGGTIISQINAKSDEKDNTMLSRLGIAQNRSSRTRNMRRSRKTPLTENRACSETPRKDKFKSKSESHDFVINKNRNDPNSKFDPDFYSNVSANVRENLMKHLDGKLGRQDESSIIPDVVDPKIKSTHAVIQFPSAQPAEIHGSDVNLNAITVFPTLLTSDQYGSDKVPHYSYGANAQTFKKIITKNSWKWKWDPIKKYKYCNEDGRIIRKIRPLQHVSPRDLSKLDIWTQLTMREKFEKTYNIQQMIDDSNLERASRNERQKQINELNTILDRRLFPDIERENMRYVSLLNEDDENDPLHYLNEKAKCSETDPNSDDVVQDTTTENEDSEANSVAQDNSVLNSLGLMACPSKKTTASDPVLSGEWTRPRCYICCVCGRRADCLRLLEAHQASHHPHVNGTHYEIVGQELLDTEVYKYLYLPSSKVSQEKNYSTAKTEPHIKQLKKISRNMLHVGRSTRILRTTTRSIKSLERGCTKCKKMLLPTEFYKHILECAGDYGWIMAKKKCKYKPFGARRRRVKGLYKREVPQEEERGEIKDRTTRPKLPPRPRIKPSDAETIQRMLANLPPKRASRQILDIPSSKVKTNLPNDIKPTHIVRRIRSSRNNMINGNIITSMKKVRRITRSLSNTQMPNLDSSNQDDVSNDLTIPDAIASDDTSDKNNIFNKPKKVDQEKSTTILSDELSNSMLEEDDDDLDITYDDAIINDSDAELSQKLQSPAKKIKSLTNTEENMNDNPVIISKNIVSSTQDKTISLEEEKPTKRIPQKSLRKRNVLNNKIVTNIMTKSPKKVNNKDKPEVDKSNNENESDKNINIEPQETDSNSKSDSGDTTLNSQRNNKNKKRTVFPLKWIGNKKVNFNKSKKRIQKPNKNEDDEKNNKKVSTPVNSPVDLENEANENDPISEMLNDDDESVKQCEISDLNESETKTSDSASVNSPKENLDSSKENLLSHGKDIIHNDNDENDLSINDMTKSLNMNPTDIPIKACNDQNASFGNFSSNSNNHFSNNNNRSRNGNNNNNQRFQRNPPYRGGEDINALNQNFFINPSNYRSLLLSGGTCYGLITKEDEERIIEPIRCPNNAYYIKSDNIDKPPLLYNIHGNAEHQNVHKSAFHHVKSTVPNEYYERPRTVSKSFTHDKVNIGTISINDNNTSSKMTQKAKLPKSKRGLNDCIAMLKGKLVDKRSDFTKARATASIAYDNVYQQNEDSQQPLDLSGRIPQPEDLSMKTSKSSANTSSTSAINTSLTSTNSTADSSLPSTSGAINSSIISSTMPVPIPVNKIETPPKQPYKPIYDQILRIPQYSLNQVSQTNLTVISPQINRPMNVHNTEPIKKSKCDFSIPSLLSHDKNIEKKSKDVPQGKNVHEYSQITPEYSMNLKPVVSTSMEKATIIHHKTVSNIPIHLPNQNIDIYKIPNDIVIDKTNETKSVKQHFIADILSTKKEHVPEKPKILPPVQNMIQQEKPVEKTIEKVTVSEAPALEIQPVILPQCPPEYCNVNTDLFLIDPVTGMITERGQNDPANKIEETTSECFDGEFPMEPLSVDISNTPVNKIDTPVDVMKNTDISETENMNVKNDPPLKESFKVSKKSSKAKRLLAEKGTTSLRAVRIKSTSEKLKQKTSHDSQSDILITADDGDADSVKNEITLCEKQNMGDINTINDTLIDNTTKQTSESTQESKLLNPSGDTSHVTLLNNKHNIQQNEISSTQKSIQENVENSILAKEKEPIVNMSEDTSKLNIKITNKKKSNIKKPKQKVSKTDSENYIAAESVNVILKKKISQIIPKSSSESVDITDNIDSEKFPKLVVEISSIEQQGLSPQKTKGKPKTHKINKSQENFIEQSKEIGSSIKNARSNKLKTAVREKISGDCNEKVIINESEFALTPTNSHELISNEKIVKCDKIISLTKSTIEMKEESVFKGFSRKHKMKTKLKDTIDEKILLANINGGNVYLNNEVSTVAITPVELGDISIDKNQLVEKNILKKDDDIEKLSPIPKDVIIAEGEESDDDICLAEMAKKKVDHVTPNVREDLEKSILNTEVCLLKLTLPKIDKEIENNLILNDKSGPVSTETVSIKEISQDFDQKQNSKQFKSILSTPKQKSSCKKSKNATLQIQNEEINNDENKFNSPYDDRNDVVDEKVEENKPDNYSIKKRKSKNSSSKKRLNIRKSGRISSYKNSFDDDKIPASTVNSVKLSENGHLIFKMQKDESSPPKKSNDSPKSDVDISISNLQDEIKAIKSELNYNLQLKRNSAHRDAESKSSDASKHTAGNHESRHKKGLKSKNKKHSINMESKMSENIPLQQLQNETRSAITDKVSNFKNENISVSSNLIIVSEKLENVVSKVTENANYLPLSQSKSEESLLVLLQEKSNSAAIENTINVAADTIIAKEKLSTLGNDDDSLISSKSNVTKSAKRKSKSIKQRQSQVDITSISDIHISASESHVSNSTNHTTNVEKIYESFGNQGRCDQDVDLTKDSIPLDNLPAKELESPHSLKVDCKLQSKKAKKKKRISTVNEPSKEDALESQIHDSEIEKSFSTEATKKNHRSRKSLLNAKDSSKLPQLELNTCLSSDNEMLENFSDENIPLKEISEIYKKQNCDDAQSAIDVFSHEEDNKMLKCESKNMKLQIKLSQEVIEKDDKNKTISSSHAEKTSRKIKNKKRNEQHKRHLSESSSEDNVLSAFSKTSGICNSFSPLDKCGKSLLEESIELVNSTTSDKNKEENLSKNNFFVDLAQKNTKSKRGKKSKNSYFNSTECLVNPASENSIEGVKEQNNLDNLNTETCKNYKGDHEHINKNDLNSSQKILFSDGSVNKKNCVKRPIAKDIETESISSFQENLNSSISLTEENLFTGKSLLQTKTLNTKNTEYSDLVKDQLENDKNLNKEPTLDRVTLSIQDLEKNNLSIGDTLMKHPNADIAFQLDSLCDNNLFYKKNKRSNSNFIDEAITVKKKKGKKSSKHAISTVDETSIEDEKISNSKSADAQKQDLILINHKENPIDENVSTENNCKKSYDHVRNSESVPTNLDFYEKQNKYIDSPEDNQHDLINDEIKTSSKKKNKRKKSTLQSEIFKNVLSPIAECESDFSQIAQSNKYCDNSLSIIIESSNKTSNSIVNDSAKEMLLDDEQIDKSITNEITLVKEKLSSMENIYKDSFLKINSEGCKKQKKRNQYEIPMRSEFNVINLNDREKNKMSIFDKTESQGNDMFITDPKSKDKELSVASLNVYTERSSLNSDLNSTDRSNKESTKEKPAIDDLSIVNDNYDITKINSIQYKKKIDKSCFTTEDKINEDLYNFDNEKSTNVIFPKFINTEVQTENKGFYFDDDVNQYESKKKNKKKHLKTGEKLTSVKTFNIKKKDKKKHHVKKDKIHLILNSQVLEDCNVSVNDNINMKSSIDNKQIKSKNTFSDSEFPSNICHDSDNIAENNREEAIYDDELLGPNKNIYEGDGTVETKSKSKKSKLKFDENIVASKKSKKKMLTDESEFNSHIDLFSKSNKHDLVDTESTEILKGNIELPNNDTTNVTDIESNKETYISNENSESTSSLPKIDMKDQKQKPKKVVMSADVHPILGSMHVKSKNKSKSYFPSTVEQSSLLDTDKLNIISASKKGKTSKNNSLSENDSLGTMSSYEYLKADSEVNMENRFSMDVPFMSEEDDIPLTKNQFKTNSIKIVEPKETQYNVDCTSSECTPSFKGKKIIKDFTNSICKNQLDSTNSIPKTSHNKLPNNTNDNVSESTAKSSLKRYSPINEYHKYTNELNTVKIPSSCDQVSEKHLYNQNIYRDLSTATHSIETEVSQSDIDKESHIQDKYLADFGMFTEKRPRKSTILAIKKISQTFKPDSSDTDDMYEKTNSHHHQSSRPQKKRSKKSIDMEPAPSSKPDFECIEKQSNDIEKEVFPDGTQTKFVNFDSNTHASPSTVETKKLSVETKLETYCSLCKRKFRKHENLLKHKTTLMHISKMTEKNNTEEKDLTGRDDANSEMQVDIVENVSVPNYERKNMTNDQITEDKSLLLDNTIRPYKNLAERKSFGNEASQHASVSTVDIIKCNELYNKPEGSIEKSTKKIIIEPPENNLGVEMSRKELSRDEALFFECCSLLKESETTRKQVREMDIYKIAPKNTSKSQHDKVSKELKNSVVTYDVNILHTNEIIPPMYTRKENIEITKSNAISNPSDCMQKLINLNDQTANRIDGVRKSLAKFESMHSNISLNSSIEMPKSSLRTDVFEIKKSKQKNKNIKDGADVFEVNNFNEPSELLSKKNTLIPSPVEDDLEDTVESSSYCMESMIIRTNSNDFSDNGDSILSNKDTNPTSLKVSKDKGPKASTSKCTIVNKKSTHGDIKFHKKKSIQKGHLSPHTSEEEIEKSGKAYKFKVNEAPHTSSRKELQNLGESSNRKSFTFISTEIGNQFDEYEDKFDKIKRKVREKAQAVHDPMTAVAPPAGHSKSRKKSHSKSRKSTKSGSEGSSKLSKLSTKSRRISKKKSHKDSQKRSHKKILTKGALKGFDSVKVSIPTEEINMNILDNSKSNLQELADYALQNENISTETPRFSPSKEISTKKTDKNNIPSTSKQADKAAYTSSFQNAPDNSCTKDEDDPQMDIYEFFEDEDYFNATSNFKFNSPPNLNFNEKSVYLTNKKPAESSNVSNNYKNNIEVHNEDSQISSFSFSDREDFNYMSDNYRENQSGDETNGSSNSPEPNTSTTKVSRKSKVFKNKKITKKSAIMGRIFKNNAIRNDQKSTSEASNNAIAKDTTLCNRTNMDQLFDSLLEKGTTSNNKASSKANDKSGELSEATDYGSNQEDTTCVKSTDVHKSSEKGSASEYEDSDIDDKSIAPARSSQRKIIPRLKARYSDDETAIPSTSKGIPSKSSLDKGESSRMLCEIYQDNIGVANRKSQRKCTTGKQNVLVESWSSESDFEDFRQFEEYSSIPRTQRHHRRPRRSRRHRHTNEHKESTENQNIQPQPSGSQAHFSMAYQSTSREMPKKKTSFNKNPDPDRYGHCSKDYNNGTSNRSEPKKDSDGEQERNLIENPLQNKSSHSKVRRQIFGRRRVSFNNNSTSNRNQGSRRRRKQSQRPFDYDDEFKPTRIAEPCATQRRNKRSASEMLYYWSSSTEEEAPRVADTSSSREPEPVEQHGWIVGDSHKKLVTMLAHAKGRKSDDNSSVKEKKSRPPS